MPVGGLLYCHVQSCTAVRSPGGGSTAAVSTKAVISQKTSLLNVLAELCLTMPSRCTYASSRRIFPECQIQFSMIGPVEYNNRASQNTKHGPTIADVGSRKEVQKVAQGLQAALP